MSKFLPTLHRETTCVSIMIISADSLLLLEHVFVYFYLGLDIPIPL